MSNHLELNKFIEASVHRAEKLQGVLTLLENALHDVRCDIEQKVLYSFNLRYHITSLLPYRRGESIESKPV